MVKKQFTYKSLIFWDPPIYVQKPDFLRPSDLRTKAWFSETLRFTYKSLIFWDPLIYV